MSEDVRVLKRRKLSDAADHEHRSGTIRHLFTPFRTIGLVSSTPVPFTSVAVGKTTFQITTSVGQSLQTYDVRKGLHLNFLTQPQTPQIITASVAWKDKVICAWGRREDAERGAWVFKRGKKEAELELPSSFKESVQAFCTLGSSIVGVCETRLLVWKATNFELYTELRLITPVPLSGCIATLPTFLNKVIVGRNDGSCEIWNISSAKLVYTILPPSTAFGAVTAIEPTPALSIIAIAYENGRIHLQDVESDQVLLSFNNGQGTPATSISFRTDDIGAGDDGRQAGVMATASTASGDINLFDLNKGGRKAGVLRAAHGNPAPGVNGGISRVEFLPGQAILVTSGLDNSLKTWIFDEIPFSPIPRILHQRSGHAAPVTSIEFLPAASDGSDDLGKWVMSGSADRSLWGWSLRRDAQSAELSQGAIQSKARKQGLLSGAIHDSGRSLKCPPITAMDCSLNRDGGIGALPGKQSMWQNNKGKNSSAEVSAMTGWESIITAHENDTRARTWFWGRRRAGRWAFPSGDGGKVTSVAMSPCGTFAVIGSSTGSIDMFNMQSGQHRQHFPARLTPMQVKQLRLDVAKHALQEETVDKKTFYRGQGRHRSPVVGLAVDEMNKTIVSAGSDGKIKFWNFQSGILEHEIDWSISTEITSMKFHRGVNLAAFICQDSSVRVVDITTYRVIRELRASRQSLPVLAQLSMSQCTISNDARWIVASMGPLVLVWDLPTGHLIDALNVGSHCVSIALSPTGEYLATATDGRLGLEIWTNRSLFSYVATRQLDDAELEVIAQTVDSMPTASGESAETALALHNGAGMDTDGEIDVLTDELDEIMSGMVSLSVVPRSKWQNLLHLDLIRQRNRPTEPPKKPEKAPFFLPALQDRQAVNALTSGAAATEESRVTRIATTGSISSFTSLLKSASETEDYEAFLQSLKQLTPAAADIEIRSLSAMNHELLHFVQALTWLAQRRTDFELCQAWMAVFLRLHGDIACNDATLRASIQEWHIESTRESQRVQRLAEYCGGVVEYLRAARV